MVLSVILLMESAFVQTDITVLGARTRVLLVRTVSIAAKRVDVKMELPAFTPMGLATAVPVGWESTAKFLVTKATTATNAHRNVSVSMAVNVITSMGCAHVQPVGWEVTAVRLVRADNTVWDAHSAARVSLIKNATM